VIVECGEQAGNPAHARGVITPPQGRSVRRVGQRDGLSIPTPLSLTAHPAHASPACTCRRSPNLQTGSWSRTRHSKYRSCYLPPSRVNRPHMSGRSHAATPTQPGSVATVAVGTDSEFPGRFRGQNTETWRKPARRGVQHLNISAIIPYVSSVLVFANGTGYNKGSTAETATEFVVGFRGN
jgi:hypothetical protein